MSKTKKIVFITLPAIFLLLVGCFFMPKTITKCGSGLPVSCQVCKCSTGLPYSPHPFGGSDISCFMGKLINCETRQCPDLNELSKDKATNTYIQGTDCMPHEGINTVGNPDYEKWVNKNCGIKFKYECTSF